MIRDMVKADRGFVLDAWTRSARCLFPRVSDLAHVEGFGDLVCRLIEKDRVLVACDDEDHDVLHGFVAFDSAERCVDYVYVKKSLRRMGIATNLLLAATVLWPDRRASLEPRRGLPSDWAHDPWSVFRRSRN